MMMGNAIVAVAATSANNALPLKQDDLIGSDFIFNLILALIVLFAVAYIGLRWYAKYLQPKQRAQAKPEGLTIIQTVRLSPRSRLLVATLDNQKILIAESAAGLDIKFVPKDTSAPTANESGVTDRVDN